MSIKVLRKKIEIFNYTVNIDEDTHVFTDVESAYKFVMVRRLTKYLIDEACMTDIAAVSLAERIATDATKVSCILCAVGVSIEVVE